MGMRLSWAGRSTLPVTCVRFVWTTCKKQRSDGLLVQEVTLADLFHLPNGSLVFERLALESLEKRPNIQRQAIHPSMEALDV